MYTTKCTVHSAQCTVHTAERRGGECRHLDSWPNISVKAQHRTLNTTLHRIALNYIKLHCTALLCTALHCTAQHCTALHCTALHCTALYCTTLHCTACSPHTAVEGSSSKVGLMQRSLVSHSVEAYPANTGRQPGLWMFYQILIDSGLLLGYRHFCSCTGCLLAR